MGLVNRNPDSQFSTRTIFGADIQAPIDLIHALVHDRQAVKETKLKLYYEGVLCRAYSLHKKFINILQRERIYLRALVVTNGRD